MSEKELGRLSTSIRIEDLSAEHFDGRVKRSGIVTIKVAKAILSFFTVNVWEFCKEDPSRVTFSLKVGLAVVLVSLLILIREPYDVFGSNVIWAILTVAVVFEYTVGATFSKGFNRGLGSIAAGILAIIVAQVALSVGRVAQPVIIGLSIFLLGALTSFMKLWPSLSEYEYGFRVVLFTFCLIVISAYRMGNPLRTAMDRLYSISIGGAVTMLVSVAIFPIWAGEKLHQQIVKSFDCVADSVEECVKQYLEETAEHNPTSKALMDDCDGEPAFKKYKSSLNSLAKEESLAKSAKWEPPHGRFKHFFYPWTQYVKVGAVLRHCAYEVLALHGCLHSEIQAPYALRKAFDCELREASKEAAALVRELGKSINHMHRSTPKSLLRAVHDAADRLQRKLDAHSYLLLQTNEVSTQYLAFRTQLEGHAEGECELGQARWSTSGSGEPNQQKPLKKLCRKLRSWPSIEVDMLELPSQDSDTDGEEKQAVPRMRALESTTALSLGTFASLLIEFIARLDHLVDAVDELGRLAKFKNKI
eukprot:Gb_00649 [translate_table: standard]